MQTERRQNKLNNKQVSGTNDVDKFKGHGNSGFKTKPSCSVQQESNPHLNGSDERIDDRNTKHQQKDRRTVVVLGDSIVKYVQGQKLSNKVRTVVKSFSGAKVDHMFHYMKPTLELQPDEVILHVGTNDLKNLSPKYVAERIADLGRNIVADSPSTKVTISSLTCRTDDRLLNDKVVQVNSYLSTLCSQNDWTILSHSNITTTHLNASGLHLNHRGTDNLSSNFSKHINNY